MKRHLLAPGFVYAGKSDRGRAVRQIVKVDLARGRVAWIVPPGLEATSSSGRLLVRGRTCKVATFLRWTRGHYQLELFGSADGAASARRAAAGADSALPVNNAAPPAGRDGRRELAGDPGAALITTGGESNALEDHG